MEKKALLLKINFLIGAITDAIMVPVLLFPKLIGYMLGIDHYNPDAVTMYIMYIGATLMAGWTFILFWAFLKPIERKGIVSITIFPLQSGLIASGIYFYISNGIQLEKILPILILSGLLMVFHCFNYFNTKNIKISR